MTARIANGGYEVVPTFKKADPAQQLNWRKINVSSANLGLVKQGMCDVVNVPGGTAYMSRFDFNGQQMCGKTGSAQVRRITMKERESGIIKQKICRGNSGIMRCLSLMLRRSIPNMQSGSSSNTAAAVPAWQRRLAKSAVGSFKVRRNFRTGGIVTCISHMKRV